YCSDIVGIPEFTPQLLEMGPITVARRIAVGGAEVRAKFALKTIVVEQGVVDVEEKDDIIVHVETTNPDERRRLRPVLGSTYRRASPHGTATVSFPRTRES